MSSLFDIIKTLESPDAIYAKGREFIVDRALEGVKLDKQTISEKNKALPDSSRLVNGYGVSVTVLSYIAQESGLSIFEGGVKEPDGSLKPRWYGLLGDPTDGNKMEDPDQNSNISRVRSEISSLVDFDVMISQLFTLESIKIRDIATRYVERMNYK